jgi:hypothetical protein
VVPEAPLEQTETGLMPAGDGWFVLNAREARWLHRQAQAASCEFEGETEFAQIGFFLRVLAPGAPMGMYHWEADQEDFLVLSGEALLIIEGEEQHCSSGTSSIAHLRRSTSSSVPETRRVSSSRWVPVSTRAHPVGVAM